MTSTKSNSTTTSNGDKLTSSNEDKPNLPPTADTKLYNYTDLPEPSQVYAHIAKYSKPNDTFALWQLFSSLAIWSCGIYLNNYWILIPVALVQVRIFIIFHDMAHLSFFSSKKWNEIGATLLGATLATATYSNWSRGHNYHHKNANNLDKKLYSQTAAWTVEQYKQASSLQKFLYRVSYGEYTLFTITPVLFFLVFSRFLAKWYENLISLIFIIAMIYIGRVRYFILCATIGGVVGFFLFHVQHSFAGAKRYHTARWSYYEVGMKGSSFLDLPWIFKYFTAGIEYHHIHHLNSYVPNYHLQNCHEEAPAGMFNSVPTLTLWEAFTTLTYSVYDEKTDSFKSVYSVTN